MSDNPYAFDETRSKNDLVYEPDRKTSDTTFRERYLTIAGHTDADKHFIGESLPAPSTSDLVGTGLGDATGNSVFPARADHNHKSREVYGLHTASTFVDVNPGAGNLNTWVPNLGRNCLAPASSTVFLFQDEGVWECTFACSVQRNGGGNFTNQVNIVFFYFNAAANRIVYRNEITGLPSPHNIVVSDIVAMGSVDFATVNVQVQYQHNDAVFHRVVPDYFCMRRVSGLVSA